MFRLIVRGKKKPLSRIHAKGLRSSWPLEQDDMIKLMCTIYNKLLTLVNSPVYFEVLHYSAGSIGIQVPSANQTVK